MKFFGTRVVTAFLLGAIVTYVYSQYEFLPYHNTIWPSPEKKQVGSDMEISGDIKDWEGNPVNGAIAYVTPLEYKQSISKGKLAIKVPKGSYQILVCSIYDQSHHALAEGISEVEKHFSVTMPPQVGNLKGRITDTDGNPKKGKIVCISGGGVRSEICKKTDDTGIFIFEGIPQCSPGTGHMKIQVANSNEERLITEFEPHRTNSIQDIKVAEGQDPLLIGSVVDRNGYPVVNAGISVDGQYYAITAQDGRFSVALPVGGIHTIEVWWGNTKVWSTTIYVGSDPFNYDIRLP
jgi:hypothetical protein